MKTLFILNDPPYGTESDFNALRLAMTLLKREGEDVKVFLMADAADCARTGQSLPSGYYNLERMLKGIHTRAVRLGSAEAAWMPAVLKTRNYLKDRTAAPWKN